MRATGLRWGFPLWLMLLCSCATPVSVTPPSWEVGTGRLGDCLRMSLILPEALSWLGESADQSIIVLIHPKERGGNSGPASAGGVQGHPSILGYWIQSRMAEQSSSDDGAIWVLEFEFPVLNPALAASLMDALDGLKGELRRTGVPWDELLGVFEVSAMQPILNAYLVRDR